MSRIRNPVATYHAVGTKVEVTCISASDQHGVVALISCAHHGTTNPAYRLTPRSARAPFLATSETRSQEHLGDHHQKSNTRSAGI